jgi:capsular polysaccharide transport system permease protein
MGMMSLPENLSLFLEGWLLLSWLAFGLAMICGALAQVFEFIERVVGIVTYIYIPFSGSFLMVATVAPKFRKVLLSLPFAHCNEMIRGGYFGEFITVYYNAAYAAEWAIGFMLVGLLLIQFVRSRIEVE